MDCTIHQSISNTIRNRSIFGIQVDVFRIILEIYLSDSIQFYIEYAILDLIRIDLKIDSVFKYEWNIFEFVDDIRFDSKVNFYRFAFPLTEARGNEFKKSR